MSFPLGLHLTHQGWALRRSSIPNYVHDTVLKYVDVDTPNNEILINDESGAVDMEMPDESEQSGRGWCALQWTSEVLRREC